MHQKRMKLSSSHDKFAPSSDITAFFSRSSIILLKWFCKAIAPMFIDHHPSLDMCPSSELVRSATNSNPDLHGWILLRIFIKVRKTSFAKTCLKYPFWVTFFEPLLVDIVVAVCIWLNDAGLIKLLINYLSVMIITLTRCHQFCLKIWWDARMDEWIARQHTLIVFGQENQHRDICSGKHHRTSYVM